MPSSLNSLSHKSKTTPIHHLSYHWLRPHAHYGSNHPSWKRHSHCYFHQHHHSTITTLISLQFHRRFLYFDFNFLCPFLRFIVECIHWPSPVIPLPVNCWMIIMTWRRQCTLIICIDGRSLNFAVPSCLIALVVVGWPSPLVVLGLVDCCLSIVHCSLFIVHWHWSSLSDVVVVVCRTIVVSRCCLG